MYRDEYTPRTWRTQPLHLCPPEPYHPDAPGTRATLDWIFLVSALNFSFWSPYTKGRYAVEWRTGWDDPEYTLHTGYWCLLAAINRGMSYSSHRFKPYLFANQTTALLALDEGIPLTDPAFYSDERRCPDALIQHIFRPAQGCKEQVPLLKQRIAVMRACGRVLCQDVRAQTKLD